MREKNIQDYEVKMEFKNMKTKPDPIVSAVNKLLEKTVKFGNRINLEKKKKFENIYYLAENAKILKNV